MFSQKLMPINEDKPDVVLLNCTRVNFNGYEFPQGNLDHRSEIYIPG